jgi:hypothetical protein
MKAIGSKVPSQKQGSYKWAVAQILDLNSKRRAMAH